MSCAGMESYLGTVLTVKGHNRAGFAELAYASFLCNPAASKDVLKQVRNRALLAVAGDVLMLLPHLHRALIFVCRLELGLQGWLLKKGKRTERWRERFVALRAAFLTISQAEHRQGSTSKVYQVFVSVRICERRRRNMCTDWPTTACTDNYLPAPPSSAPEASCHVHVRAHTRTRARA